MQFSSTMAMSMIIDKHNVKWKYPETKAYILWWVHFHQTQSETKWGYHKSGYWLLLGMQCV